MRILLVSSSSGSRGGGEIYLRYLAQGLLSEGHTVALWSSSDPAMDELHESLPRGCESIRAPYRNTYAYRTRCWGAWRNRHRVAAAVLPAWRTFKPEVLLINKQNLEDGLDLLYAAQHSGIPACCTIHITQSAAELGSVGAAARDRLSRKVLSTWPGTYIAISEGRTPPLQSFVHPQKLCTVLNGIPPPPPLSETERYSLRQTLDFSPQAPYLLCVARLETQKAPGLFLDRAEELLQRHPEWHALWLGGGSWKPKWDERLLRSPVADRIHHHDWVDNPVPWFAEASLYYHPAAYEGLPLSVLEALAHGLPTVLSPAVRAEAQALLHSDGVFTDDSAASWWNAVNTSEKRTLAGEAARETFNTHFTLSAMTRGTLEVLHDACA